jgi:acyl-CoA thioesterase
VTAFDEDTHLVARGDGVFEGRISERWWVARGPHGGFLAALLMRAFSQAMDDGERAARSFTAHFITPPDRGPVSIATRVERVGRSRTSLSARMEQDGLTVALALAAFSVPWTAVEFSDAVMPQVPSPDRLEGARPPGLAPSFLQNFEARWAVGDMPFTGSASAVSGGWLRLAEPRLADEIAIAALADAWVPSVFPRLSGFVPVPTLDLTVHFRRALPLPDAEADDFYLSIFRSRTAAEGFFVEDGDIWSESGELVAQSRQLAVMMGGNEHSQISAD